MGKGSAWGRAARARPPAAEVRGRFDLALAAIETRVLLELAPTWRG
ncbi:MAG: hypothetical protein IT377_06785 [Polyangiaceae bacterium]|nr:hypothetical protein [Polyangiaceae bacterium]